MENTNIQPIGMAAIIVIVVLAALVGGFGIATTRSLNPILQDYGLAHCADPMDISTLEEQVRVMETKLAQPYGDVPNAVYTFMQALEEHDSALLWGILHSRLRAQWASYGYTEDSLFDAVTTAWADVSIAGHAYEEYTDFGVTDVWLIQFTVDGHLSIWVIYLSDGLIVKL